MENVLLSFQRKAGWLVVWNVSIYVGWLVCLLSCWLFGWLVGAYVHGYVCWLVD